MVRHSKRHKRKRRPQRQLGHNAKCRDCGMTQTQHKGWYHATKPRCVACGGLLDKVRGQPKLVTKPKEP